MANTYTLISSNVLGSSAASVTFSAIPSTYTDLVLRFSGRGTAATTDAFIAITYNGTSETGYSVTRLEGSGSAAASSRASNNAREGRMPGASNTANTFGSGEVYVPNYAGSTFKPMSYDLASENNTTDAYRYATAGLFSLTSAITSIVLTPVGIGDWASGSSFYLYGIKNS
jgi:hypothetical protein